MFAFYIEHAMKEKGCPLSRIRREAEEHYVLHSPVCAFGEANESVYAGELTHKLVETTWQAAYQASGGLYLPHLRLALNESDSEVGRWLLAKTEGRLRLLHHDPAEYLRKHSLQYHAESISKVERQSWIRAIAFARGEKTELKEEK